MDQVGNMVQFGFLFALGLFGAWLVIVVCVGALLALTAVFLKR